MVNKNYTLGFILLSSFLVMQPLSDASTVAGSSASTQGVKSLDKKKSSSVTEKKDTESPNALLYKYLFGGFIIVIIGTIYYYCVWKPGKNEAFWKGVVVEMLIMDLAEAFVRVLIG